MKKKWGQMRSLLKDFGRDCLEAIKDFFIGLYGILQLLWALIKLPFALIIQSSDHLKSYFVIYQIKHDKIRCNQKHFEEMTKHQFDDAKIIQKLNDLYIKYDTKE